MKIISMLASLLVLLTLYSCKEEVLGTKPTFDRNQLIGRWVVDSTSINGVITKEYSGYYSFFTLDSVTNYTNSNDVIQTFSYNFNKERNVIEFYFSSGMGILGIIEELNENHLRLKTADEGIRIDYYTKIDVEKR